MNFLKNIIKRWCVRLNNLALQHTQETLRIKFKLHPTVSFYNISLEGNIEVGQHTYINEGTRIDSGQNSSVVIGCHCAIGRNVHITAKTHNLIQPTTDETHSTIPHIEKNVIIEDYVWIGDHVVIMPGVTISSYAVVGAHSLVKKDVKLFEVVGGVPAQHIKFNRDHYRYSEFDNPL